MEKSRQNVYESNMELLKKKLPNLWMAVRDYSSSSEDHFYVLPENPPNLKVETSDGRTIFFHDRTDPDIEVTQFLKLVSEQSRGTVIFQGMGLGYGPLGILEHRNDIQHLIIFELSFDIFIKALETNDLSRLFSDPRVILSVGKDPEIFRAMSIAAKAMRLEEVSILRHMPCLSYWKDAYERLNNQIYATANEMNISGNTFKAYGKSFVANRLAFLSMIHHTSLIDSLKGQFKDIPAILVASGPSLEKNIDQIRNLKEKAVIISVDSALPPLMSKGIQPDFVTSIDYRGVTYEKIAGTALQVENISLICSSWVGKKVAKIFPASNIFWAFSSGPMERWLNQSLGGKLVVPGSGTVAHLSLIAAMIMECSPIVFVGQDLSLPMDQQASDHAKGAVINTDRRTAAMLEKSKGLVWVKGNHSPEVPTTRSYQNCLKIFEKMISGIPGEYINASAGGAYIEGTQVLSLEEVARQYCQKEGYISKRIEEINNRDEMGKRDRLLSELRAALKTVKRLKNIIKKGESAQAFVETKLTSLKKHKQRYARFENLPQNIKNKIKEIDDCHGKLDGEKAFWSFFDEATFNELKATERMRLDISKLENDPLKYLEWLKGNLDRLGKVNGVRKRILSEFGDAVEKVLDHHTNEIRLQNQLEQASDPDREHQAKMELVRLYEESGDLVLAKPLLEQLESVMPDNPELNMYSGMLAAHYMDYKKAEACFAVSRESTPLFEGKIDEFKKGLASEYLGYANWVKPLSQKTYRTLLFKGLRYDLGHDGLLASLDELLSNDVIRIEKLLSSETIDQAGQIIGDWLTFLDSTVEDLSESFKNKIAGFYKLAGMYFLRNAEYLKAFETFYKAISLTESDAEILILLAETLKKMGRPEEAEDHIDKAIKIDPDFVEAYFDKETKKSDGQTKGSAADDNYRERSDTAAQLVQQGNSHLMCKEFQKAVQCYEKAILLNDKNVDAIHNLGKALHDMGKTEQAVRHYEKAIGMAPEYFQAYFNLGVAAQEFGEARKAIILFEKALELKPDFSDALSNLGNACHMAGEIEKAVLCFKRLIELAPDYIAAYNNLGVVYQSMGMVEASIACFQKFLQKKPDSPQALENLITQLQYACEWKLLADYVDRFKDTVVHERTIIKPLQSLRLTDDPGYHLKVAESWAPTVSNITLISDAETERDRRSRKKKIRIGYLSSDIKDHAVAHVFSTFIDVHDRSEFEIFCYSAGADNTSFYRKKIKESSDLFVDIHNMGYLDAAKKINNDDIDILIEMNGYTKESRLKVCAFRPAPVQAAYLGFLGSSGTEFVDYIITDENVTPEEQQVNYSETFAYLPDCYQVTDFSSLPPSRSYQRSEFGLPETGTVFCSFNQPYKFEPAMFSVWMNILNRVPESVLWLRRASATAEKNLKYFAESAGVSGERIIFSDKLDLSDHLKRLELADIALDTRIYNGGATTNNALWSGIPVITLPGNSFVSRMSSSSVTAIGTPELIVNSLGDYENLAVSLATDSSRLMRLKEMLSRNKTRTPLFDIKRFVSNLEELYKAMWHNYLFPT